MEWGESGDVVPADPLFITNTDGERCEAASTGLFKRHRDSAAYTWAKNLRHGNLIRRMLCVVCDSKIVILPGIGGGCI